jgi:RHS repeat-associated protein
VPKQRLEFAYDASGRRIQKVVKAWNTTTSTYQVNSDTRFLYDGFNLIAEFNGLASNAVVRTYVWGTDLSGSLQGAGGVGGLLAVNAGSATYFPTFDGNGNVLGLVNASTGTLDASFEYDPFGNVIKAVGVAANLCPFGFSTRYTDLETGIVMYPRRPYNPSTGRFLCKDPLEEDGGLNLYGFCGNDSINGIDPFGLKNYHIGSPTEPPMSFDDDFVFDPNAHATLKDYRSIVYWEGMLVGGAAFRPDLEDAIQAYRHYLGGSGSDMEINYPKAYREDQNIQAGVMAEIGAAQADAERLSASGGPRFTMTGDADRIGHPATENWQKTIGQHYVWGSAEVEACGNSFSMTITIHEKDRYNFNRGSRDIATGKKDDLNGRFATLGWAKSFITNGRVVKRVTWEKGNISPAANIQDPPR